jgi:uncharacterized protein
MRVDGLTLQPRPTTTEEWPQDLLDIDDLFHRGWRPQPFRQFVLKVHSRCNLACTYCYVYRSPDQTWRLRPTRMSEATVRHTARRVAEHVRTHQLQRVEIALHGGEPLLVGDTFLDLLAQEFASALPVGAELSISVQTNATLLDEAMLDSLAQNGIRVGVSLDGGPDVHNARRGRPAGGGSYDDVRRGLTLLASPPYRHLFAGLLCVVDPSSDPVATYDHLAAWEPPVLDFLLPHANWSAPPRRAGAGASGVSYAGWLITAFDRWYGAPRCETSVRLFDEIIRGVLGQPSRIESVGLSPVGHIVVETDGTIEQVDALKSAYHGAAYTGLHVRDDPFDTALLTPHVAARQIGVAALADQCQRCDVRDICGGGYYPHRYLSGDGFRNPSVYCEDLGDLIRHVRRRVREDLAQIRVPAAR